MHLAYFHYLCEGSTGLNHVHQFSDAARGLGHRVDVHPMNLEIRSPSASGDEGLRLRLRHALKKRAGRYLHEPKELLWNARYLRREFKLVRSTRPDVLLVRDAMLVCASAVVVARRLGIPLVIESNAPSQESRLFFDEYAHLPFVPEWIEGWKMHRADAIVTVSSSLILTVVLAIRGGTSTATDSATRSIDVAVGSDGVALIGRF